MWDMDDMLTWLTEPGTCACRIHEYIPGGNGRKPAKDLVLSLSYETLDGEDPRDKLRELLEDHFPENCVRLEASLQCQANEHGKLSDWTRNKTFVVRNLTRLTMQQAGLTGIPERGSNGQLTLTGDVGLPGLAAVIRVCTEGIVECHKVMNANAKEQTAAINNMWGQLGGVVKSVQDALHRTETPEPAPEDNSLEVALIQQQNLEMVVSRVEGLLTTAIETGVQLLGKGEKEEPEAHAD